VVMLARVRHGEYHRDLWVELGRALLLKVVGGVELESVFAKGYAAFGKLSDPAVGTRGASTNDCPTPVGPPVAQRDGHAFRGTATRGVEHVRRNAHELSMLLRRRCVIFRCSSAAT